MQCRRGRRPEATQMKQSLGAAILMAASLAACHETAAPTAPPRPVRTITVAPDQAGETVTLTGHVRAKEQASLAFRLDGRMLERRLYVGDVVAPGQVVARLDPQIQQNAVRAAQAALAAAQAQLTQARLSFERQQTLLRDGWTPRAKFDDAQQVLLSSQAQVDSAQAQLRTAQEQLGYTTLIADGPGVVTAVGAEPGEVVRAGQSVVQVARDGGRDAVFDVPEQLIRTAPRNPVVEVTLTNDPAVRATGRVREVAPEADAATRTFQVKVALIDPPPTLRLGASVSGRIHLAPPPGVALPASVLTRADGHPAVWVVDPNSQTVALRGVEVARYEPTTVVVSRGLEAGERVVSAGVQTLRPGQKVLVLGGAS
ncbi:MAG: efflux RND transporter periplasmic adaptor subunit [Alphaproteobacteria bacterium]|nr:efflux RND transporter periplasmic adaptor subunit [Alphaproteobacteria bacterium]